jgi:predicted Zn-dependent protease
MTRRAAALRRLALASGIAAIAVACATNPATGKREFSLMSESQEVALGKESDPQIRQEMGVVDDPQLQGYVDGIARRLASATERPQLPWTFAIVDAPAVNAFAVPGGFVYLTRGILAHLNSEAELAGVLGHEIAHVTARHSAAQYSKQTAGSLGLLLGQIFVPELRPFGQAAEASLLETLGRLDDGPDRKGVPNWLSTHPMPADRVARLEERVTALRTQSGGRELAVNRAAYLDRIAGLMFGVNPREGVLRGNAFLHPDLRFRMEFPQGWQVQNTPQQVVAQPQGGGGYVFLQLVQQARGRSLEEVAAADLGQTGLQFIDGGDTRVNGLPAFIGTFRGQLPDQGDVVLRAAWIAHEQKVFRVAGLASPRSAQGVVRAVDATVQSFQPLSRGEADRIRPNVIRLHTAQAGDTWERLATGPGAGVVPARTLAVLNGYAPQEPPRAGDRMKIVVEAR